MFVEKIFHQRTMKHFIGEVHWILHEPFSRCLLRTVSSTNNETFHWRSSLSFAWTFFSGKYFDEMLDCCWKQETWCGVYEIIKRWTMNAALYNCSTNSLCNSHEVAELAFAVACASVRQIQHATAAPSRACRWSPCVSYNCALTRKLILATWTLFERGLLNIYKHCYFNNEMSTDTTGDAHACGCS